MTPNRHPLLPGLDPASNVEVLTVEIPGGQDHDDKLRSYAADGWRAVAWGRKPGSSVWWYRFTRERKV
jgi:hypothetical protein